MLKEWGRWSTFPAILVACATVQDPPGGPPDFAPPALVSIMPDSGAVVTDLKRPAVVQFNEVINERPSVTLDQLIIVSPRTPLTVSWKRDAIEVKPRGGWRPDVPYLLTLLPGIMDLRNNKLTTGRTVLFSTGGPIPDTRTVGRALDWEGGVAAVRALVELTRVSDSLIFWSLADSTGAFAIAAVPPGRYLLSATIDKNGNRRRDYREPFDSALVTLDSTLTLTLWAFTHDSLGPRIRTAQRADSTAIRLEFTQPLAPGGPPPGSIRVRALPDSVPLAVTALRSTASYDSTRARAREAADTGAEARPGPPAAIGRAPSLVPGQRRPEEPGPDSALTALLGTRSRLSPTWIVVLGEPLLPGARYVVNAAVPNASGALGESSAVLVLPREPVRDTTQRDSSQVRP